jgi:hypothetical protein
VKWWGSADVSLLRYNRSLPNGGDYEFAWDLMDTAEVLITNRRLIYRANSLSRKPGRLAHIRAGIARAMATWPARLSPNAYLGHVRFEWAANVFLEVERKWGISVAVVMVTVVGHELPPMRLGLGFHLYSGGMSESGVHSLAQALAGGIANYRLSTRTNCLLPSELKDLACRRDMGDSVKTDSGALRWDLPGALPFVAGAVPDGPAMLTPLAALGAAIDALGLP